MTHVHFIGIGGSGLSAIARLLKDSGYTVTGSDRTLSPFAADLQTAGVTVYIGHHPRYIQGADWVVRSSAVPDDNPEVQAAHQADIPVYKRADFLGKWMEDKTGIAVAGTHGKTTTTAMIAFVMSELGCDPSFIVGGVMNNYGVNARAGKGNLFVIEADEYDRMFLGLKPRIEVITNLEHDHPDCFPRFEDMVTAFESFVSLLPTDGCLIACIEDKGSASLMNQARRVGRRIVAYSIEAEATINAQQWVQARNLKVNENGGFDFEAVIHIEEPETVQVSLQVPGRHNVLNALAVLAVTAVLNLSAEAAGTALGKFTGTGRRFEVKGKKKGITVIDDYAHHPTEIKATLAAARARYKKQRLVVVWQPHTYSRTRALLKDFSLAFEDADEIIVTEIYAAREPMEDFSSEEIVKSMPHRAVRFIASLEDTTSYLFKHLRKNDVLLVLSAGDADLVSVNILAGL